MFQKIISVLGGDPNKKVVEKYALVVEQINALEARYEALSDAELRAKTDEFKSKVSNEIEGIEDPKERAEVLKAVLDELLVEAFAAVREASKRTIGLRHYDVQLIGGMALHHSSIAEMRTGEGKTLVATLPIYLNALSGRGVHLVTVNDYLARRDARWMAPIFEALGLTVGILQMAAVTENGKMAFVYDSSKVSPQEDKDKLRLVDRVEAYNADVTYGTNSEFGFDYLRDNMTMRMDERVQRGHYFAIVDEVDNVLIDEARTPLIISGPASGDLEWYSKMTQVVRALKPEDYEVIEKDRTVTLTEIGIAHVEQILGATLRDLDRPEDVTPEQARMLGYLEQCLRAHFLFKRNKDYLVQSGKVVIVDEHTGRLMPGRRWSDGLHQAVEAKEGVKIEPENITYATVTLQNFFRMYEKLAGMTGTAITEAEEFHKIYKLDVLPIPTNLEYSANRADATLAEVKAKDEDGYEYIYFARKVHPSPSGRGNEGEGEALFFRRKDYPDVIYRTFEAKLRSIATEIVRNHALGRPLLVGTTSVENSEVLSTRLRAEPIRRLMQIALVREAWFTQNNQEEDGRIVPDLQPFNAPLDKVDPAMLRQFARNLNLNLSVEDGSNLASLTRILRIPAETQPRLKAILQGGVPHEVLNARKHTEESQIIAGAGAFGAVTIATNMAGRGVDIKLGGELAEEIIASVNRVLRKAGYEDPYDMRLEERRLALQKVDPSLYGIYEEEVKFFLQHFADMENVRKLGGLHVIGSERHDARRIDNQLRGRAARQGDPGSSRFYLSLEDELMRMFGGQQMDNVMQRLKVDDSLPLENRIVSNLIESSQHRVEGANFDVRKHLLEYDDVLNSQRKRIYEQRDRVFAKEDLGEDVLQLIRAEVEKRVPEALKDEEGPWKLLAWLEQTQPPFGTVDGVFPSFTFQVLLNHLAESKSAPLDALLELVRNSVKIEQRHLLNAIESLIEKSGEGLEAQLQEGFDGIDNFLNALSEAEETTPRKPQEIVDELNSVVHVPLRLNNEQTRLLREDPRALSEPLKEQIELVLTSVTVTRVVGAIENRLNDKLNLNKEQLAKMDWNGCADEILNAVGTALASRLETFAGENGQVSKELVTLTQGKDLSSLERSALIQILGSVSQSKRTLFDAKSHRQIQQVYSRFSYVYYAADLIADENPDSLTQDVLEHLDAARLAQAAAFGHSEAMRLNDGRDAESLGKQVQTAVYRQSLLSAISELWVDYLTRVEALRVSIGLEAYAQRDPLVQYKTKASEMFQTLLNDIRSAVISRIFLYQPRQFATAALDAAEDSPETEADGGEEKAMKKKRKRH